MVCSDGDIKWFVVMEILKGSLNSCLEHYIGLGLGFVGQMGVS